VSLTSLRGHIVADRTSLTNMHGEQRAGRARRKRSSLRITFMFVTLVNTGIRGYLVGNTQVLRNRTADGKYNFNAVFHLILTITYMHSCFTCSVISGQVCPNCRPCLSRFSRRAYPQAGSTAARALEKSHIVLKESDSFPGDWTTACAVQKAAANLARCLHQFWLANMRLCLLCSTQARLNMLLQEPSGPTISCGDAALGSRKYLALPLLPFPALHKCSLSRFPASEGYEDRKRTFENALLHFGVILLL
jgi:hypothetical protein